MALTVRRADPAALLPELWRLLDETSAEFVPPLAARFSTTQADLSPAPSTDQGVAPYLTAMVGQSLLVAEADGEVVGFASFREHHVPEIPELAALGPCTYLTTIITSPFRRGLGIGRALYQELLRSAEEPVLVRTWSTNADHLRLLNRFRFSESVRLVDDRGAGVDTLYYISVVS